MRKILLLATIALLGACSDRGDSTAAANARSTAPVQAPESSRADAPAAATARNVLSVEGIGAIRFGMTLAQAEQAAGGKATLPTPFDPACSMVRFPALPKLRFMIEQGTVTRADADPGVDNAVGIAVGDTLEQVRARHPEAKITPHKYDANGHYLTFPSSDGRAAIILEEAGGKVTKLRAGLQPAVAYVETCG